MPRNIRWRGTTIYRPGMYTYTDLSGLQNIDLGAAASILVIGEAAAGQPQATAASPVYHAFTNPDDMGSTFQSGNLADVARFAFTPAASGQNEDGVPIRGCDSVYAVKTNQSTQAVATLQDGSAHDAFSIADRIWGLQGNQNWWKVETSGTGVTLTLGRENAPNIGSQTSPVFGATDVDEWLSLTKTGNFAGSTLTVAFDGTSLVFDSSEVLEDLTVTVAGKTMQDIIQEINAKDAGSGSIYTAVLLRAARTNMLASYLDVLAAPLDVYAGTKKLAGVAYDMVEWVNANSVYVTATWIGGYEPQTSTLAYMAGGTLGYSTETTITEALKTAKKVNTRFLVMAYNEDVGSGSAVSLSLIQEHASTHADQCNPIGGRCERQVFVCTDSITKAALWTELEAINSDWLAAVNHEISRENPSGVVAWMGTHCTATAAAAIMAGSPIGTPLTQKYVRGYDYRPVAADFDDTEETDFAMAITKGLLFLELEAGVGIRFAKGISTYKTSDNDGHIMLEVVEERLWFSRILRRNVESTFIGHKGKGIRSANAYRGLIISVLQALSDPNSPDFIFVSGTDAQGNEIPPYRNIVVWLSGDQLRLGGEVTFTQGINWALNEFTATLPTAQAS